MSVEKIGRYQVTGELGKGAMGVVYKATDPTIGRTVALKTMRLDLHAEKHEDMLRRFQNEARAAGALSHANIVTIYDAGEADGIFYIAMEYIEGITLARLLCDRRSLPAQEVVEIGSQICAGLQYAHFRKVVHRDIKPHNIMLTPSGTAKIMDFGIAKAGSSLTQTGEVLGTPHFMSPEQVKGQELDGRTDIFSLGVVLYEMLTGEKPFVAENVSALIYKIVHDNPVSPREVDVSIHPGLSMIVTKCLAKDPDARYQEAADLATALKSYKIISVPNEAAVRPTKRSYSPPAFRPQGTQAPTGLVKTGSFGTAAKPGPDAQTVYSPPVRRSQAVHVQRLLTFLLAVVAVAAIAAYGIRSWPPQTSSAAQPPKATPLPPRPETPKVSRPPNRNNQIAEDFTRTNIEAEPSVAAGVGELRITSNPPGAQVTIDGVGQEYYVTPFNAPPMKPGKHVLTAMAPGLAPQTREVQVVARKRIVVDFQLAGENAIYNIVSSPEGAEIFIDGASIGSRTPAQIPLKAGTHRIALRLDGFQPVEVTTRSSPGETVSIAPRLLARNSVDITGHSPEGGTHSPQ